MKIALALSGAGSRVGAHLGVIKALLEFGFEIEAISATSAGAIVSALYLNGYSIDEILKLLIKTDYKKLISFRPFGIAPFCLNKAIEYLDSLLVIKDLERLDKPLFVCVVDIKNGRICYLNSGSIAKSVIASSAFLPIFRPIQIDGVLYADGGVMNNLPIEPLKESNLKIVGINANPITIFTKKNPFSYTYRTLFLLLYSNIEARKKECDIFIEPQGLERYFIFDTSIFEDTFKLGYEYAKRLDFNNLGI